MRSLYAILCVFIVASVAHAHLRHKESKTEPEKVLSAGPSYPAKIAKTSFEEAANGKKEDPDAYVIPQYKAASIERPNPSVTKGFCKGMLEDVKNKKAPYWLEGHFTGESRKELMTQCGQHICTWGKEMAAATATCGAVDCPKDCSAPKDFVALILEDEEKLGAFVGSLLKLFPSAQAQIAAKAAKAAEPHSHRFKKAKKVQVKTQKMKKTQPAITKEFCEHVLEEVKNKQAPYFIKNHETGVDEPTELLRDGLVAQCNQKVCGWLEKYNEQLECKDCAHCDAHSLSKLKEAHHLVPLLEKIVTLIKAHPVPTVVEHEDEATPTEPPAILPSANDPRDPDFHGATGAAAF